MVAISPPAWGKKVVLSLLWSTDQRGRHSLQLAQSTQPNVCCQAPDFRGVVSVVDLLFLQRLHVFVQIRNSHLNLLFVALTHFPEHRAPHRHLLIAVRH